MLKASCVGSEQVEVILNKVVIKFPSSSLALSINQLARDFY